MRNFLMAAVAAAALMSASVAMADEFNSPQQQGGVSAYLDNQATNSEFADPTAPNSIHSHGHP